MVGYSSLIAFGILSHHRTDQLLAGRATERLDCPADLFPRKRCGRGGALVDRGQRRPCFYLLRYEWRDVAARSLLSVSTAHRTGAVAFRCRAAAVVP
jgi:hypothetical protein